MLEKQESWEFLVIEGQCHSCILRCNIIAIKKQPIAIASLVKELSGKGKSVTDSAHYINTAILCPGSCDVDVSVKQFSTVFDGEIAISVDPNYEGSFHTWISRLAYSTRTFLFTFHGIPLLRWLMSFGIAISQAVLLFCCWILLKLTEGMNGQKLNSNMSHAILGYMNWGSGISILLSY